MRQDFRSNLNISIGDSIEFKGEKRKVLSIDTEVWRGEFYYLEGVKNRVHYSCFMSEYKNLPTELR